MKLANKLIAAITPVVVVGIALYATLRIGAERDRFEQEMSHDHGHLGHALAAAVEAVADEFDDTHAASIVDRANRRGRGVQASIVWASPRTAKEGRIDEEPQVLRALEKGDDVLMLDRGAAKVSYVPLRGHDGSLGAIRISESRDAEVRYVRTTVLRLTLVALALAIACAAAVTLLTIRFIARPLESLVSQARRIGEGDLSSRLAFSQRDEMHELADEMNAMCERIADAQSRAQAETARRLAALTQLRHADRLSTVGTLASGLAHELGTPLNVVSGRATLIFQDPSKPEAVKKNAKIVVEQAERMTRIIRQMLDFARRREPQKGRVDIGELASRTVTMLEPIGRKKGVHISLSSEGDVTVDADSNGVQQVLTNLVMNAVQATEKDGRVEIAVRVEKAHSPDDVDSPSKEYVCIHVRDTGGGISDAAKDHIFEPFFTTKDVGEGTGLGLSVSYGIVQDHGGFISVDSKLGEGAHFVVYLPAPTDLKKTSIADHGS
ncbi:MAG: HAMP domain-containing histidine kinase [Polyangiaceae bacterium]|nr:HAMP domain-containing histidine kinase [Polyangiaceae bacterium]